MKTLVLRIFQLLLLTSSNIAYAASESSCVDCIEKNNMFMSKVTSFELDYSPKEAIYLFTAEGEKYWVKGWEPTYPRGNGYNKHDVFVVNSYDGKPFYIVLDFDDKNYRAFYSEVIPNVTAGTLEINIKALPDERSLVTLEYNISALSKDGQDYIKQFGHRYDEAMLTWKTDIENNKKSIDKWLKSIR